MAAFHIRFPSGARQACHDGSQGPGVFCKARWIALFVGMLLLCVGAAAQARVVGLVFDDSGSMTNKLQKALFAAQLVVGSLDAADRLFVVRLNGEGGHLEEVPPADRTAYLRGMQTNWKASGNTPYQPLVQMLEQLVQATPQSADAALLVFTDGEFSDAPPAGLARDYQALRARFPGRNFQAFFISLPGQSAAVDVRGALLTAFNGAPDAGATPISRAADIVPRLRDLVAVLAGADPVDPGRYLRQDGARVHFKLPFSVRRVILLTSGDERTAPARWLSSSFPLAKGPPEQFEPEMRALDPGEHRRLKARIVHLVPSAPLPAATDYLVELDRPLRDDDRILFVSGLAVELRVLDQHGVALPRDAQHRVRVPRGNAVVVQAWLTDESDGQRRPLDLAGSGVTPVFTLNDGLASRPMAFDPKVQRAGSDAGPYQAAGQFSLSVVARIKGLSYVRSDDLMLQVEPVVEVSPTLAGSHLMVCPDCAPERVEIVLGERGPPRDLFAITATVAAAPRPGQYRLSLDRTLPDGVELVRADGKPVLDAQRQATLTMAPNQPIPLLLRYDDHYQAGAPTRVRLSLQAAEEGLRGAATLDLDLVPKIAVMRLLPDGHTLSDQTAPFSLPVTEVGTGDGVYVAAEGLRAPLSAEHLVVEGLTGLPARFAVRDDRRLLIMPTKRLWCDCLTPAGLHRVRVSYANPVSGQAGSLELPLEIGPVPVWERCWQEFLLALVVLGLVLKGWCLWRTAPFPPRCQVWQCAIGIPSAPRRRGLHRRWRRLFALGCADERRREFGLLLVARDDGVGIARQSCVSAAIYRTRTGECLSEVFAANPQRPEIPWAWNEELRDEPNGYRYLLVRDRKQQSGTGCD